MTSLGFCNVMNYCNGSYTVISYSYGFMEFCPFFFQSPDIITSHNPLSDITNPSWALSSHSFSLFSFVSAPPSISTSIAHPSMLSGQAGQVRVKLTGGGCSAPMWLVWTASSSSTPIRRQKTSKNHPIHNPPPPKNVR